MLEQPNMVARVLFLVTTQVGKIYPDWPHGGTIASQNTFWAVTLKHCTWQLVPLKK